MRTHGRFIVAAAPAPAGCRCRAAASTATAAARPRLQRLPRCTRRRGVSSKASASGLGGEVCSLKCSLMDVPGGVAEEVAEVLLAYGAQSVAVEEFQPAGGPEQVISLGLYALHTLHRRVLICHHHGGMQRALRRRYLLTMAAAFGTGAPWWLTFRQRQGMQLCGGGRLLGRRGQLCPGLAAAADLQWQPASGSAWLSLIEPVLTAGCSFVVQLDGGAILASAADDYGLSAAAAAVQVEAVRTQDWEQSIKVGRCSCCTTPACACGSGGIELPLTVQPRPLFTLPSRLSASGSALPVCFRTATSQQRWGRASGLCPCGASRPTPPPQTSCLSRVRRWG